MHIELKILTFWQLLRRVNIEFTVIFAVVLLDGLNWRYTASSQPNINTLVRAPVNPILLFAIDTLVWLALAVIQVHRCHAHKILC